MKRAGPAALGLALAVAAAWSVWQRAAIAEAVAGLVADPLPAALSAAGAAAFTRWRYGTWTWGLLAALGALAATAIGASLQAWCVHETLTWHGMWEVSVMTGHLGLALAGIAAGVAARGGRRHRVLFVAACFGVAMAVVMSASINSRMVGPEHHGRMLSEAGLRLIAASLVSVPIALLATALWASLGRAVARRPGRRPVDGWTLGNTVGGYGMFVTACGLAPLWALLSLLAGPGRARMLRAGVRVWMLMVFRATPTVRWSWCGERAHLDGRRVMVANHESMLDIVAGGALPGTRNLLAKSWVFRAPALGVAAHAMGIRNVDRLDPEDYRAHAAQLLGTREGLLVFAEGRRSRDGRLGRFRLGAFALAEAAGGEVVPAAMSGSAWSIRPDELWIHPARWRTRVLAPMRPHADESQRAFAERVRDAVGVAALAERRLLIADPVQALNRRGWTTGLPRAWRAAAAAEERSEAWRATAAAAGAAGDWWIYGVGRGPALLALRAVSPWSRLLAGDPDHERRAAAAHGWLDLGVGDALGVVPPAPPADLAGILCWSPLADPAVASVLANARAAEPPAVVVPEPDLAAWREALPRHAVACTAGGLVALARSG